MSLKYHLFSVYAQSFEALSERAVAVVVDPIQSVKGKVNYFLYSNLHVLSIHMTMQCQIMHGEITDHFFQ